MLPARRIVMFVLCLALASGLGAVERVEVVFDSSAAMWRSLGQGPPQFVGVRAALLDYAATSAHRQGRPEIALRVMGASHDRTAAEMCEATTVVQSFELADPSRWFQALAPLTPHGGRPLAAALRQAVADLAGAPDRRRLVLIVAGGGDDCHGDVVKALAAVTTAEPKIDLRIIGLGLDRDTITAAGGLAPTRNLTDISALREALLWALEPSDTRPAVATAFDITLSLDGTPAARSEITIFGPQADEPVRALVRNGQARLRSVPGRFRAEVRGVGTLHELAGLILSDPNQRVAIDLVVGPPATLEAAPETPTAGGSAWVRAWGVPERGGWVAVATPGAPPDAFLLLTPVAGGEAEVRIALPDAPQLLELRLLTEAAPGVLQLVGSTALETVRPAVRIDVPDRVEARLPMTIAWTAPGHEGDVITLVPEGAPASSHAVCVAADAAAGAVTVPAPVIPGPYVVTFISGWGHALERRTLEVFEVLATLDAPASAAPAVALAVGWNGPGGTDDFLSIAAPGAAAETYLSWAPTGSGSPAELRTPSAAGTYEIRYVRGLDGEVLAREPLEVVHTAVEIEAPDTVASGTRFTVTWRGTTSPGDFIAVVPVGAAAGRWFDFAYTTGEGSLTLAAPYKSGPYELRYLAGGSLEILATRPLEVR